jgi:C4-dicarboxylate transporter, DctM subunit
MQVPVASALIAACAIAKADIWEATKNFPFILAVLVMLFVCTYVPNLSLC